MSLSELGVVSILRELDATSTRLNNLKAVELTPEEASRIRTTYFGDVLEVLVSDFESLRRTAIEAGETKEKLLKAEEEKFQIQQELETSRQSLYQTSESFRQLGKYFQAYIDYIKDVDPNLDKAATKYAVKDATKENNKELDHID